MMYRQLIRALTISSLLCAVYGSSGFGQSLPTERTLEAQPPSSIPSSQLLARRDALLRLAQELQDQVRRVEFGVSDLQGLEDRLVAAERYRQQAQDRNDTEAASSASADIRSMETRLKNRSNLLPPLQQQLAELVSRQSDVQSQLNAVEREIFDRIDVESPQQDFKLYMSYSFGMLVAIVIIGFFLTAGRDEHIRRNVFSGQAGLQFITLFSLVIAIILFGIIGVLESRELSALLGGLSGYILGRSTGQGEAPPTTNDGA